MIMHRILQNSLVLVILFSSTYAFAQSATTNVGRGFEQRGLGIYTMASGAQNTLVKGSTYLFPDWKTKAIVSTKSGKSYKLSGLNYDAKLDKLVAKIGVDSLFSFNPSTIDQAIINNRTFKRYLDPEFSRNSFYEVLVDNKSSQLLKRINVTVKDGYINPMTKTQEVSDSYTFKESYFIYREDSVTKISSKKREFLKMFKEKSIALKEYMKSNKLSIKKENDLKQIFKFFNTL